LTLTLSLSALCQLTLLLGYISMADSLKIPRIILADSVNLRLLFPELFLFPVLPIIPEIIREQ